MNDDVMSSICMGNFIDDMCCLDDIKLTNKKECKNLTIVSLIAVLMESSETSQCCLNCIKVTNKKESKCSLLALTVELAQPGKQQFTTT